MYPLNTILTFTSLTHASAAADLFGRSSLESLLPAEDLGLSLFDKRVLDDHMAWEPGFYIDAEKWRLILDTPEKVKWFEPQVGDLLKAEDATGVYTAYGVFAVNGLSKELKRGGLGGEGATLVLNGYIDFNQSTIILRNGQPFPQPQDVKLGETV